MISHKKRTIVINDAVVIHKTSKPFKCYCKTQNARHDKIYIHFFLTEICPYREHTKLYKKEKKSASFTKMIYIRNFTFNMYVQKHY